MVELGNLQAMLEVCKIRTLVDNDIQFLIALLVGLQEFDEGCVEGKLKALTTEEYFAAVFEF